MAHVSCSRCGARCSEEIAGPPGSLTVRAWVECPECIQRGDLSEPGRCAYLSGFRAAEEKLAGEYWKAGQAIVRELDGSRAACGAGCSHDRTIVHPGDETFFPQRGCLDCGAWLDPVRLRRP